MYNKIDDTVPYDQAKLLFDILAENRDKYDLRIKYQTPVRKKIRTCFATVLGIRSESRLQYMKSTKPYTTNFIVQ